MRCLILIALCLAVANASYFTKNRFHKLLNRYQNRYDLGRTNGLFGCNDVEGCDNVEGCDDVEGCMEDYVDQIRCDRGLGREQCPRDIEDILSGYDDEWEPSEMDNVLRGRQQWGMDKMIPKSSWYDSEYGQEFGIGSEFGISGELGISSEFGLGSDLIKEVHDANTKLATRLYKQCKDERDDKNTIVSPLSVQLALASLNYGARGNTKRQIGRVIAGRLQKHERRQVFKMLIRHLKGLQGLEYSPLERNAKIQPVTGIFLTPTTHAQQQFIQMIKTNLGTTIKKCDFQRQPQHCRQMVNQWMAQRTQGKINHIVPQDAITDNTKMILVNSMNVKANWGPQMRQHVTKEAKFYPLDTNKVKVVEVLETEGRFKYYEDELVKIVGLPTEQKEMTLYLIVPKEKDGLNAVDKLHLQDSVQLKQLLQMTDKHRRRVGVQLPKFQIKHKIDVRRTLLKQGVTDAFDSLRADFSSITGVPKYLVDEKEYGYETMSPYTRDSMLGLEDEMTELPWTVGSQKLHLNKFIHQCTIKITENGITSSMDSGSQFEYMNEYEGNVYGRRGLFGKESLGMDELPEFFSRHPTGQKIVKANRAFAFALKHNPTNQLVFIGRVIDAAQKKVTNVRQTINVVDQL